MSTPIEQNTEALEELLEIANELPDSSGDVDLTIYATKQWVENQNYLTDVDLEAIVQQVITALGTPVFGRVDLNNRITMSDEHLVDGTYTIGFENADGEWVLAGTYVKEAEAPYTNMLEVYTITLNKRWSSSGESAADGMIYFKMPWTDIKDKTVRIKGFEKGATSSGAKPASWYPYIKDGANYSSGPFANSSYGETARVWDCTDWVDEGSGVYRLDINASTINVYSTMTDTGYIMAAMIVSPTGAITEADLEGFILTIDEQIV